MKTKKDYNRAIEVMDQILDKIGEDESHPLAEVLDYLASQIKAYELVHVEIPTATPADTLRFLMEQNDYTQSDLTDCAPQSRISEILNGKRAISKELAKAFAQKFQVSVAAFI